jgi:DNA helicase-2/ATP-dependent DNA helicase PcrA
MIPSDMSTGDAEGVEEERRLFYVALTRAKDHLHVYFPLRYYHTKHVMGDGHSYAQLTRFISPEMRHFFDDLAGDGEHTGLDAAHWDEASQIDPVVDDVDRYINDLWQP